MFNEIQTPSSRGRTIRLALTSWVCTGAVVWLPGCGAPPRRDAVPVELQARAEIPGMPAVRYSVHDVEVMSREAAECLGREKSHLEATGHKGPMPPAVYLALSGGGDNGAFGAGLLNGWTAHGDRPSFKLVTGISTGALIAPFAFLGARQDATLKHFYTNVTSKDILTSRGMLGGLFSDALADNKPLRSLIRQLITPELLDEIAAEYEKGRLLLVGTTNLDTRRGVIWNMTRIAASRRPNARELFCDVLTASAAIPAAFPPVLIDVEVDGKTSHEMHVDGGTVAQVFVYPPTLNVRELTRSAGMERERRLYVIRNSVLDPEWAQVARQTLPIASRAIASLIHTQGRGDLYMIYLLAQRDGVDYNLAYIPPDFKEPHPEEFHQKYMRRLFETGYDLAVRGYPWQKVPPGYVEAGK